MTLLNASDFFIAQRALTVTPHDTDRQTLLVCPQVFTQVNIEQVVSDAGNSRFQR